MTSLLLDGEGIKKFFCVGIMKITCMRCPFYYSDRKVFMLCNRSFLIYDRLEFLEIIAKESAKNV